MTFPRQWPEYDRLIRPDDWTPRERARWTHHFLMFLRKLSLFSGKRPLLKNPYNTARLALLAELFPRARFVHIHRNPYTVYRSNAHLEREGHVLNQVQDPLPESSYSARFLENYRLMEDTFYRDAEVAAPGTVSELRASFAPER